MQGQKNWKFDVYVDKKTNKVLSIGNAPADVPSDDYTQVDAINSKQKIKVGMELGPDNVNEVYDIKTAANGTVMDLDQETRLKIVKFGVDSPDIQTGKIKVVTPPRRYSPVSGWGDHPRFGPSGVKFLQLLGPGFAAYALFTVDNEASAIEFQKLAIEYENINTKDPAKLGNFVDIDVKNLLARYIDNPSALMNTTLLAIHKELQARHGQ